LTRGIARPASARARSAARMTRAKRFWTFSKQSSTVTRAKGASEMKCERTDIRAHTANVKPAGRDSTAAHS
jgi:hypothetical protein